MMAWGGQDAWRGRLVGWKGPIWNQVRKVGPRGGTNEAWENTRAGGGLASVGKAGGSLLPYLTLSVLSSHASHLAHFEVSSWLAFLLSHKYKSILYNTRSIEAIHLVDLL